MNERHNDKTDDTPIEALLQGVGPRPAPPTDLREEVRAAVCEEWRHIVGERTRRRRRWLAAAASLAAIAIAAWTTMLATADVEQMASVAGIEGHVVRDAGWLHPKQTLASADIVYVGDEIATASNGRVAFAAADGISLRVDTDSIVRLAKTNQVVLERGAVYVDSGDTQGASTFVVSTRHGTIRHIGTQYLVQAIDDDVHVSVRSGRVIVDSNGALHEGQAGEQLSIGAGGIVARSAVTLTDERWRWISSIAPPFAIENRSLAEFLNWFSRETGRAIEYADASVQAAANETVLRGSIANLEPAAAFQAVLATTDLSVEERPNGTIVIAKT